MRVRRSIELGVATTLAGLLFCLVIQVADASASSWWALTSGARPSVLQTEGTQQLVVTAQNRGDTATSGEVVLVDKLPVGLKGGAVKANALAEGEAGPVSCSRAGSIVTCTFGGSLPPYGQIEVLISVAASGAHSGELNAVSVTGGGGGPRSTSRAIAVDEPLVFGVEEFQLALEEADGTPDTQAGSHPFQVTAALTLNQSVQTQPVELPKDIISHLPPGLIGNPTPLKQCTVAQFDTIISEEREEVNACPANTAVGVATVTVNEPLHTGIITLTVPVFNVEPEVGEPARFGLYIPPGRVPVLLDASIRTGTDYGVNVGSSNIIEAAGTVSFKLTFWGVPGAATHDPERGWGCLQAAAGRTHRLPCTPLGDSSPPPFLSLPTSCTGPLHASIEADSWQTPMPAGGRKEFAAAPMQALDGCNKLPFAPTIEAVPDGSEGSSATGLSVDVHVPQDSVLDANGLAESNVKGISVALPEGLTVNPAGADGLEACSESAIGYLPGDSSPPERLVFTPELGEPFCPDASKIGTVTIHSPLLPRPLIGAVYLAAQNANPFGTLIASYIVARDSISGAVVKLPGEVQLSETGRVTAIFNDSPQLAFEDAEVHFFGGDRAPLATPSRCGTYSTEASFSPWSGNRAVSGTSTFEITSGPNGGPCPGSLLPFTPELAGGSTNIQAGAFTPLTTSITRSDGDQSLRQVILHMPPGLSGLIASVTPCDEVRANAGTCGTDSLIGETTVSVGVGGDPFSVRGGKVYVTGPYKGAPFGLSIVNPAVAGPFNLGIVVVRAKLDVNPTTAAITVTTDGSGPYSIPRELDGIPLAIQHINVLIKRPNFIFNPTNCSAAAMTGEIVGTESAVAAVGVPFQVTNCASLKFAPKFAVSTEGHASRANGASLSVKLSYPKGAFGAQANISKVKVELPRQLPSQLKTLQKACLAKVFEANPANCPAASVIGHAKVLTPVLPVPLTGPAYFVSHGNEAFPSLTIVLQGDNVSVDVVGTTLIRKGITSSTFKAVPDVPFDSFELTLPKGQFAALAASLPSAANYNFCGRKLAMPTEITAQNGMLIKQRTPIGITGCKVKNAKKPLKHRQAKRH
jgi:hypothetical protein